MEFKMNFILNYLQYLTKLFTFGNIDRPTKNYLMAPNSDVISITRHSSNIQCRIITGYLFSHLSVTISLLLMSVFTPLSHKKPYCRIKLSSKEVDK